MRSSPPTPRKQTLTPASTPLRQRQTAADSTVDLVCTYTVASIGVRLVATTAAMGFALLRENNGITAVSTAQREAINAGYTKAIDDLAANLTGHNANEALDDPLIIASAQQRRNSGRANRRAQQHLDRVQFAEF
ncbi:MAG TPA: hypothetical protein PLY87_30800 [Planctomycetaceae bacterium]|nr:hypothetical protein [Planctomycetaceae bacterium]